MRWVGMRVDGKAMMTMDVGRIIIIHLATSIGLDPRCPSRDKATTTDQHQSREEPNDRGIMMTSGDLLCRSRDTGG
jgi:hypothetical protein